MAHRAEVLRILAEVRSHQDPRHAETAEILCYEAIEPAGSCGNRPLIAHCHLGLGKLCRRFSKREEAQEQLITAMAMYRETDIGLSTSAQPGLLNLTHFGQCLKSVAHTYASKQSCLIALNRADA